ncbi:MAG TPA: methyl-accepting chemotaxis protein [Leptolyngbyaceae cyanobacterium]
MKNSTSWRLRHWIIGGYAIPVVALMISGGVAIANADYAQRKAEDLSHYNQISERTSDIAVNLQIMSRVTRGYLLDQNQISLDVFKEAQAAYHKHLDQLDDLVKEESQQAVVDQLRAAVDRWEATNLKLLDIAQQGKVDEARKQWAGSGGRDMAVETTKIVNEIEGQQEELAVEAAASQKKALVHLKLATAIATTVSLVLSIAIGAWIIKRTAAQMAEAANIIASSTAEIAASVEQQERVTNQQATSVNETTTTMDELGVSSRQSSEQAGASVAGAQQALNLAQDGTCAVDRTLAEMELLRQRVGAIADQILRLSEQTSQIGSISGLVSDLANQTNMLALNAAVEAVRAGEHGKGFAVVSGEIRKLADQSKKSADKINTLVNDIQNAINSTVMVTDEGTKTVETSVAIANQTAEAFAGVTDAMNNVVLNSQQISLNVQQQAVAIYQVVGAMGSLNSAAKETASGISQIKVGTHRLNEAAISLKALV